MSTASEGRRIEWKVRDHLTEHGWYMVMRAAGSRGAGDLLMAHPEHGAALIQVGRAKSKRLGPADRARLLHAADLCSALPLLATYTPYRGIRYHIVNPDPAGRWDEYHPDQEAA